MKRTSTLSASRPKRAVRGGWNNVTTRALIYQVIVVGTILLSGYYLFSNAQQALERQGIATGFSFLWQPAGFEISETPIAFNSKDTFFRAYGVAILNTLKVAAASIILATLLGVIFGLGRLSDNALLRKLSTLYVEIFRNTPQLIQLVFWYTIITNLPRPRDAISLGDSAFISNRGISVPWLTNSHSAWLLLAGFMVSCVVYWWVKRYADHQRFLQGKPQPFWRLVAIVLGVAPFALAVFSAWPMSLSVPELRGFNFQGGFTFAPEFTALTLGLSLYIGAFLAEIVRSGIQSVNQGQIEAAQTVGLSTGDIYRKIVFPQALRVMIPPATGQYVSIVKNSSLGVAIGYPELFNINNTIVTLSGHTVEAIGIMMSIYLLISFAIAALMNIYNRMAQIKER
jgi:general L-amino acid transport system permease protein